MQFTITAKIQIKVEPEQRPLLDETLDTYRQACNYVSNYVYQTHDLKQPSINKALYYTLRERFKLKSQMAQSVIKTVIARYKTILENQRQWIKPSFTKPQYDLVWNRDYSINGDKFSVNTLSGRMKLPYFSEGMEKYFNGSYSFGTAKLVSKHGKYFLHIPMTAEAPESLDSEICNVVGIDRGINFIVSTFWALSFPHTNTKKENCQLFNFTTQHFLEYLISFSLIAYHTASPVEKDYLKGVKKEWQHTSLELLSSRTSPDFYLGIVV